MRIAIIGTGRVGTAIAQGWRRADHDVVSTSRSGPLSIADAAANAAVVVLAVPWTAVEDVAGAIAPATGQIVIDCTNPIAMGPDGMGLSVGHTTSGAEHIQRLIPQAHVIKALNQVGAEVIADTSGFGHRPTQFIAGDDDAAKARVTTLLSDLGFDVLDAGGIVRARLLEPLALVWINQAMARGKGRNWALCALDRAP